MAPIKFEEHIKEKLDSREIQPSAGSWGKLNARLDNSENNGRNRGFWITSIAAVMILLIAGTFYINQQKNEEPVLVEEPVKAEEIIRKPEQNSFELPTEVAANKDTSKEKNQGKEVKIKPQIINKTVPIVTENEQAIATTGKEERNLDPVEVEEPKIILSEDKVISAKIEKLIAATSAKNINANATEAEVDALLMQAAREISEKNYEINYSRVDAEALLAGTERELDESFRNQVFEKLKENFLKAKTAVATRNY